MMFAVIFQLLKVPTEIDCPEGSDLVPSSGTIEGQFFIVKRLRPSKDGKTVFDILFMSYCGNFASTSGETLKRGFPDRIVWSGFRVGFGVLNFKKHFHVSYLRGWLYYLSPDDPVFLWHALVGNDKFEVPSSEGMCWNWSQVVAKEIWESQGLNNKTLAWSEVAKTHERKLSQRQKDKAYLHTAENLLLYDSDFRAEFMAIMQAALSRRSSKSEIKRLGRISELVSLNQLPKSSESFETLPASIDTRTKRLENNGDGNQNNKKAKKDINNPPKQKSTKKK